MIKNSQSLFEKEEKSIQHHFTVENALKFVKAGIHFGHKPNEWNPKMAPYILTEKNGYHIFDLVKTRKLLNLAGNIVEKTAKKGQKILFVGTTEMTASVIKRSAIKADAFYINSRWLGGMFTNWPTIQKQVDRLIFLENSLINGEFSDISKKEASKQKKELGKLRRLFNGIKGMQGLPDLVIFTNQFKEKRAIQECIKVGIPAICIVDSNCDPDLIPYPIPANDDSLASINLILTILVERILEGVASRTS